MIKNDLYRIPFPARGTWFEFYIRFTLGKYENGTSTERRENLQRKNNFFFSEDIAKPSLRCGPNRGSGSSRYNSVIFLNGLWFSAPKWCQITKKYKMKIKKEAKGKGKTPTKVKVRREKRKTRCKSERRSLLGWSGNHFSMSNHNDNRWSKNIQSLFSGRFCNFFLMP